MDAPTFVVGNVLLLGGELDHPTVVDGITLQFGDDGVAVRRHADASIRVLPWSLLAGHAVEPWHGGILPEWWVDPELERDLGAEEAFARHAVVDPAATSRPLPLTLNGALVSVRTPQATYRFLVPGGDPVAIGEGIAAAAAGHRSPAGATTMTTVARPAAETTIVRRPTTWQRVQPLVVALVAVVFAAAATLILLQSAGAIHLHFLGGTQPSGAPARLAAPPPGP
ncbi:MAG: hypothetical protein M0007_05960 [Actinomycetota bacterium]|nr:hypothetical protein [Actinomycetota bacterium]